ncbi:MAG: helix-turn-helix domain-containing protein, partial [Alphaproteobacteria bacterium]|nr:helix-turn-helix domain-containing protein [Alphaproteobacteria bacterium]
FKLKVIERLEAGESGTALAMEFSIKRTIIYRWRELWRHGGTATSRDTAGPKARRSCSERRGAGSSGLAGLIARPGHGPGHVLLDWAPNGQLGPHGIGAIEPHRRQHDFDRPSRVAFIPC